MRLFWLVLVLVGCNQTKNAVEGEKVVAGDGDHLIVGTVRIDVELRNDALFIHMHDGARNDTRGVVGSRMVKFGAHRVRFDENGSRVAIVVRDYKLHSPLTSDDALLTADEAMSPKCEGLVDCTSATLSVDGATFMVHCRDTDHSDSGRIVTVDAVTGAILAI